METTQTSSSPDTATVMAIAKPRLWPKRLAYAACTVVALWALAWVAVPPLIQSQAEKWASEQLGRKISFGKIDFKPWTLELELRDVVLAGASANAGSVGSGEQLRVGRAYIDAELQSLLRLAPVIDSLQIEGVRGHVVHLGGGKYDFDDILAKLAALPKSEKPSSEPPKFAIYNIQLKDWALTFDDRPVDKKHQISELALSLPFLSTLQAQRDVKTQPHLAFVLNGSRFDSTGETTPFMQTRKTDAKITIKALDLAPYLPYLPANLPVKPISAMLAADLTLAFEQGPKPTVRITGPLQADNIVLQDAKREPLLVLDSLKIGLQDVQPLAGKVVLDTVEINAPQLQLRRNAAGQLNLLASRSVSQDAIKSGAIGAENTRAKASKDSKNATPEQAQTTPVMATAPWQISINRVTLQNGSMTWADETTTPRAALQAQALQLDIRSIAWPFAADKPLAFEGSSQVSQGNLIFSGSATDIKASVTAQLSGLPLAQLTPYTSSVLTPALTGLADVQAGVLWQAASGEQKEALQISLPKLQLANVQLTQGKTRLAQLKWLSSEAGQLDLLAQTVKIGKIAATGVQARVERSEQGRWMVQDWLKTAAVPASSQTSSSAIPAKTSEKVPPRPWKVSLGEISLDAPSLSFVDRAPTGANSATASAKTVALDISALKAKLTGFELEGDKLAVKPMPMALNATLAQANAQGKPVGEAGKIDIKGQLALTPLAMQLDAQLSRLPIHAFEPYFADALNIDVLRLEASYNGKLQLAQTLQGLHIKLAGDALAEELQTTLRGAALAASSGAVAGDELLNWRALSVKALAVEVNPGAPLKVDVGEAAMTDFFARILISEQGRINLSDIVKTSGVSTATSTVPAVVSGSNTIAINSIASSADSIRASGLNDSKTTASTSPEPIINIGAINLINGKVFFSDRFIKPNYAANLSELTGKLGAFSSQPVAGTVQMADLELRGKAEGTAALEILGKLNPLAKPLALNIKGKVRDLELAPLSPYSVKYAGHGIERGKLSVDIAYVIQPDGQLTAANNIVLNQIKFGDKVEGAPNSLPVKLAVALLADRHGVIDINLPVSGSLNDPQFSVGGIVFKLIINLVVKAITSPFSLLASAFGGGGDELGQVSFASGSAALSAQANPSLEKIVRALKDRPNLKMTVVGQANLEIEREGYKKERLKALIAAEKRRSLVASSAANQLTQATAQVATQVATQISTPTAAIAVSDAEYPVLLKEVYKRSDITKPRNAIGLVKDIPIAEMEALLLASLPATEQAMQELALARGVAVRDHLAAQGLPTNQLFLGAAKSVAQAASKDEKWSPRAELSLAAP